jgi:hypothetical protein
MTKDEIINKIKSILGELSYEDAVSYLTLNDITWLEENVKALEQETVSRESYEHEYFLRKEYEIKTAKAESILDKIKDELCNLADCDAYTDVQQAFNDGVWEAVKIIDKYKLESEKQ